MKIDKSNEILSIFMVFEYKYVMNKNLRDFTAIKNMAR